MQVTQFLKRGMVHLPAMFTCRPAMVLRFYPARYPLLHFTENCISFFSLYMIEWIRSTNISMYHSFSQSICTPTFSVFYLCITPRIRVFSLCIENLPFADKRICTLDGEMPANRSSYLSSSWINHPPERNRMKEWRRSQPISSKGGASFNLLSADAYSFPHTFAGWYRAGSTLGETTSSR